MSRTNSGAAATDTAVATNSSAVARVISLRTNAVPPSGSSRSARASTGTNIAVNVASSTSAATRLGSWLAIEKALDRAAPRMAASSTMRMNPVIRLTSVATAIPQDRDTTAASLSSARPARRRGAGPRGMRCRGGGGGILRGTGGGGGGYPRMSRRGGPAAQEVGPADHRRDRTVAAPARRAGPRYSLLLLFARVDGRPVGFVV